MRFKGLWLDQLNPDKERRTIADTLSRTAEAICLHPNLIGVPHRIPGLDWARHYIPAHERVRFATGEEIVRR